MSDVVEIERVHDGPEQGLVVLTLANPPLNLVDRHVLDALAQTMTELSTDPPRALLLHGAGGLVSAGVDVHLFDGVGRDQATEAFAAAIEHIVQPLEALPCPTVAAVEGLCLTAGFELALACDLIVAADTAQLGLIEASLGLTPALGGTQRLATRAGLGRAREAVLTGRLYSAATMAEWGVVNRVLPVDGFLAAARRYAVRLAAGPTRAHAATKDVLHAYATGGVKGADDVLPGLAADALVSADAQAAVRAFLEHGPGKATFIGS